MFSPLSDLATDTQILEFQGCHVGHAQQQSLRAQPPRVVSSRQGGPPSAVHASSKILVEREVRPEQQREALHRAHTVHMSLDPGLVRPFAISVRPGRIRAIPSYTGIPLRHHVLGNSIGARVAIELAARQRARSVVAVSPSGLNTPVERLYQGALMGGNRIALRCLRALIPAAARTTLGRSALLAGLRSTPWRSSETEARALRDGFADADAFWLMLWWGILADVPTGLDRIDCPVVLAQGTGDLVAVGQTPRYLTTIPGARFVPLLGAGHAPQSDVPEAILQLVEETTAERRDARTVLRPTG
jgi:pimeloyl-ACP methyl ester carboxylesterase